MKAGTESRWPARFRDQSGQTTFFVLCSFFTFFMFFALVVNVGQAVNRRVLLQMVADAGAFSGASAQATAMNTISEFNQAIDTAWDVTEVLMLYFTFQFCGLDNAITGTYKAITEIGLYPMITVTNHGGAAWAIMEAEMVTLENIKSLFRGDYSSGDSSVHTPLQSIPTLLTSPASAAMGFSHAANLIEAWPALKSFKLVRLEEKSVTKSWLCYAPPWTVNYKSESFKLPLEKTDDDEVTRFYWWVKADPVDALLLAKRPWFPIGFPKVPEMHAAALAKPVGGEIKPDGLGAKYVAKMIPLSIIDAKFFNLGADSFPNLYEVLH